MDSFYEILSFFASCLKTTLPSQEVVEQEGIELVIDKLPISLTSTEQSGGVVLQLSLGLLLHPIHEEHLKELSESNFLGVNTGGCTLVLDEAGVLLFLKATTTPGFTLQEHWEWLHRLLVVAREWIKHLGTWDEFVPLATFSTKRTLEGKKA